MAHASHRARLSLGATTVTYLPDGEGHMDSAFIYPASVPDGWAPYAQFLDADGRFPVSIGSFLVQSGDSTILIDLGLGPVDFEVPGVASFQGGRLIESLTAEGLSPSDIDTVFFTHLHHDHVGWTTNVAPAPDFPEGAQVRGLTFGMARHLVSEAEWRHWSGRGTFPGPDARAVQEPLAGRIAFVAEPVEGSTGWANDGKVITRQTRLA